MCSCCLQGIQPVTRTCNTLMIACNTSGQWPEALRVYEDMLAAGHVPNTTTYNALITAHSKAGSFNKVLEAFQQMVQQVGGSSGMLAGVRSVLLGKGLTCSQAQGWQSGARGFPADVAAEPWLVSLSHAWQCAAARCWEHGGSRWRQVKLCMAPVEAHTAEQVV